MLPENNDLLTAHDLERGHQLQRKLVEFGRLLWDMGLDVGPGRMVEASKTISLIDVKKREDFYHALKCTLLSRHEQEPLFDQAFFYFWQMKHRLSKLDDNAIVKSDEKRGSPIRLPPRERQELEAQAARLTRQLMQPQRDAGRARPSDQADQSDDDDDDEAQGTAYSAIEQLRGKDFESYSWEEMQEAKRLMAEMHWHLGERPTRRKAPSRKGAYPDLRRIIRRNMKYGGELMELTWRKIRRKPRPLVIICDISGSMSLYSRLLLHFIHTISSGLQNTEAFVFGTRLTRITRQLRKRDVDDAVRDVSKNVQDWSGGTRIGECLRDFNYRWARRVLGHGAVVLIISDGWDRGEPDVLRAEMDRLQHSSHRLIWLNPLLGAEDYRPVTIGMKTALPFIDNFLSAHSLDSLLELGKVLEQIDDSRPSRRGQARLQQLPGR
ncbi:MAG TPA: VWA domain-containing protein [Ktedonobacterales bacterium]|jgi:hypothetical protein